MKTRHLQLQQPVDAILLLGPTGVGKSPLGDIIARHGLLGRRAHHMDFGSELRSLVRSGASAFHYTEEELDFIRGVLDRGLLLENEHFSLARKIILLYLDRIGFHSSDILILNGIPRHKGQAQDMSSLVHIHALVLLDCPADSVYCRLRGNISGDRKERTDDTRELVIKKLQIFADRTAPLIEHFRKNDCNVYHVPITATSTPRDAYDKLSSLAAADPPLSLVAEPPQR